MIDFEVNNNNNNTKNKNNNHNNFQHSIVRQIKRSKFYWGTDPDGVPTSLFSYKQKNNSNVLSSTNQTIAPSTIKYWPYDGISIIMNKEEQNTNNSPINIFILGQVVIPYSTKSFLGADILSFSVNHSLGFIITYPYDSPDLWDYSPVTLPSVVRNLESNTIIAHLNW